MPCAQWSGKARPLLFLPTGEADGSFDATSGCSAAGVPPEPQLTQSERKIAVIVRIEFAVW